MAGSTQTQYQSANAESNLVLLAIASSSIAILLSILFDPIGIQGKQTQNLLSSKEQNKQLPLEHIESQNKYLITPKRRALLNTIRYAEGTWMGGKDIGYRTIFGGGVFNDFSKHPNVVVVKRYKSAAAGAYQFIPGTWNQTAKELNLANFNPHHQDQAALHLAKKRGALKEIDLKGLTKQAISLLSNDWASFPNSKGKSNYGQPNKTHQELRKFYHSNLKHLNQGK